MRSIKHIFAAFLKSKYTKIFIVVGASITTTIFIVIVSCILAVVLFEKEITNLFVQQINKNLQTKIEVSKIDFGILRSFPMASVSFQQVNIHESGKQKNPKSLLIAENVQFSFSIFDLLRKKYTIKKVNIDNGSVRIIHFKDGADNYSIWKTDSIANKADENLTFNIEKLKLHNVSIWFKDFNNEQEYSLIANKATLKVDFDNIKQNFSMYGNFLIQKIQSFEYNFFVNKTATIVANLAMRTNDDSFVFEDTYIETDHLKFDVNGKIIYSEKKKLVDLTVFGEKINLQSFINELPENISNQLAAFKFKGIVNINFKVKGSFLGNDYPRINADITLQQGTIEQKENNIALNNISFSSKYNLSFRKGKAYDTLFVHNLSANFQQGYIKGNFAFKNLSAPLIETDFTAKINLTDIKNFFNNDSIEQLSGDVLLNLAMKTKLTNGFNISGNDIISGNMNGNLSFDNVTLKHKLYDKIFHQWQGKFQFTQQDVQIEQLTGFLGENDLSIKGYLKNILPFIFDNKKNVVILADYKSKNLHIDQLISAEKSNTETAYNLHFQPNIIFNLNATIENLFFQKFHAQNVSANFLLSNQKFKAKNLQLQAVGGTATGELEIEENSKGEFMIKAQTNTQNANISDLFYAFENFGQTQLTHEKIKGIVSANIQFAGVCDKSLKIDMNKIYATAVVKVEKGELINFEPLQKLSAFIKLSELKEVKFATLTNTFEVSDGAFRFPEMAINSSAMNIFASGEHRFTNEINYRIRILLSELLAKKAKEAKKENEEFGVVEDDGLGKTGLYLLITGTTDDPKIRYDAKGVKEKIVVSFIKEKQNLKNVLNEEFGWFKRDSAVNVQNEKIIKQKKERKKENQIEEEIRVEWE